MNIKDVRNILTNTEKNKCSFINMKKALECLSAIKMKTSSAITPQIILQLSFTTIEALFSLIPEKRYE